MLWAQGPGGSNRTTAGKRHTGYGRAPLANRGHRGGIGRCRRRRIDVAPIPNLAYYLVVNVQWFICRFRQKGQSFAQQGWQESNPRPPGWSRLSVPLDYTPSSVRYSVVRLAQEYKRAAPFRKRLLNELDVCKS